jgi:DNA primase
VRIRRGFSEELRTQADIVRVVSDYVSLKKRGTNLWACCPFHHEEKPSFTVNPVRQVFKCFGCGKGGDVFRFVMDFEGCSFPEAIQTVAEKCGVPVPAAEPSRELDERERFRSELRTINQWATEFFEKQLTQTPEGRRASEYFAGRGVSPETQRSFHLGFAPESWDALSSHLLKRGATVAQVERSGLVTLKETGRGHYDRFRGRVMFPITDAQGHVVAFGGRVLGDGEPKYLNLSETALYTKGQHLFGLSYAREAIRKQGEAIIVEGYLDFLVPFQAGAMNLVASLGTALTEQQVRLLKRYAGRVVVNFDPDAAGASATKRSLELLVRQGFSVRVLSLPGGLDPDEFVRSQGVERYRELARGSQFFMDYVVGQALKTDVPMTPAAKVETFNAILPYLKLVRDKIEQLAHFEQIVDRLKIDNHQARQELKRAVENSQDRVSDQVSAKLTALTFAERRLLEILLNYESLRERIVAELKPQDYQGLRTTLLIQRLIDLSLQGDDIDFESMSRDLNDEELARELLPELLVGSSQSDEKQVKLSNLEREAHESLFALRSMMLESRQRALRIEIDEAQRAGDAAKVDALTMSKLEVAREQMTLTRDPRWSGGESA